MKMKIHILALLFLLFGSLSVSAQTNATDFTATDCNSASHNLFTELNNGKIIVLVWVMPCASCISDGIAAYDAVQSFAVSHPGKVKYYLIDDVGNVTCATLSAWATTNGITPDAAFDNVGVLINENDYGGGGMPHVVVVGGTDHKIFLNIKDGSNNEIPITNAINEAINPTGINESNENPENLQVYPNPVNNNLNYSYALSKAGDVKISIVNIFGVTVKSISLPKQAAGIYTGSVGLDASVSNGIYFLQLNTGGVNNTKHFSVIH